MGWMKLSLYDKSLYNWYLEYYKRNTKWIDDIYLNLEYYSNFELAAKHYEAK